MKKTHFNLLVIRISTILIILSCTFFNGHAQTPQSTLVNNSEFSNGFSWPRNINKFSSSTKITNKRHNGLTAFLTAAPNSLKAIAVNANQIDLSWVDTSFKIIGFEIERSGDSTNFTKIANVAANVTTYKNTGLTKLTKYWYRIRTKNENGYSDYSNVVSTTTLDLPPIGPTNLVAKTFSSSEIDLVWKDISNNETGFDVERSTDSTSFTKIGSVVTNVNTFRSSGLTPKTKYWYRVRAKNAQGNSDYSNIAFATTKDVAPNAPQNLIAKTITNKQIDLSWKSTVGGFGQEASYEVEMSLDGTNFEKIADVAANIVTYQSSGLATYTKYWYRIRAKNAIGYSGYSNVVSTTTFDLPPIAPTNLVATTFSSSEIDLVWKDISNNETGFDIEKSTDSTIFTKIGSVATNVNAFRSTSLSPATKYYFRIRSRNSGGASDPSNIADATTKDVVPNDPTALKATIFDFYTIQITWQDQSKNELSFEIERSLDGVSFVTIDTVLSNINSYQDTGLKELTNYYYRVRAFNAIGYSGYSNVANATTPKAPAPTKPENLKVTPMDFDLIRLTWRPVSANSKQVVIERSTNSSTGFVEIGKIGANMNSFDDREILEVMDYFYRIKAINDAGSSDYSEVANLPATAIITGLENKPVNIWLYENLLHITLDNNEHSTVVIYNMNGIIVDKTFISSNVIVHSLSHLLPAIYIAKVEKGNHTYVQKIAVIRN